MADGTDFAEVLQPVDPGAPRQARAIWLDGRHLRWTLPDGATSVVLLGSANATLKIAPGTVPTGFDVTLKLAAKTEPSSALSSIL